MDAFRIDTAYDVPPEYFEDFLFAADKKAPGMARVAEQTGRRDFFAFGEGFGVDAPGRTATSASSRAISAARTVLPD